MADPLLNLDTAEYAAHIRIDGATYGVRHPNWLSLFDYHRFQSHGTRIRELSDRAVAATADDEAELSSLLARQVALVLDAPADVLARLRDGQRIQIVSLFLDLPGGQPTLPAAPEAPLGTPPPPRPGTTSSSDSVDSSATARAAG